MSGMIFFLFPKHIILSCGADRVLLRPSTFALPSGQFVRLLLRGAALPSRIYIYKQVSAHREDDLLHTNLNVDAELVVRKVRRKKYL